MATIERPENTEYSSYYRGYVERVPDGDVLDLLAEQTGVLDSMLEPLSDEQARYRIAPEEWSIKEVVGHLVDAERTFAYRAFAFSRGESGELPSMEQDDSVQEGHFDDWSLSEMLEELGMLRKANLIAFRHLTPEACLRHGVASGIDV
ncbi:MAG: DinB family protein, partial [Thermomicrobiales bacterium]